MQQERNTRSGRSRQTARFLKGSGYSHPIRAPLHHPGSPGKRVWTRSIDTFRNENLDYAITDLRKAVHG